MLITQLPREEWEKLKVITLESLETEPQAFATTYEKKLAFDEFKWKNWLLPLNKLCKSLTLFAVNDEGEVFGKATALMTDKQAVEIVGMYVRKDERRKGAGKLLLEALLKRVVPLFPDRKVILEVSADQEAAIALYEKMGFDTVMTKEVLLGDKKLHQVLVMELENTKAV